MKVYCMGACIGYIHSKSTVLYENTDGGAWIGKERIEEVRTWRNKAIPIMCDGNESYAVADLAVSMEKWEKYGMDCWELTEWGDFVISSEVEED